MGSDRCAALALASTLTRWLTVVAISGAALWGCSGGDAADTQSWEVEGSWGALSFEIDAVGPLGEGTNRLAVTVLEEGAPADDVRLTATAEMSAMSHGESEVSVASEGEGRFRLDVDLTMPGEWLLVIEVERHAEVIDGCALELEVR
ncbi:MAG: FixH family protein [Polyangiaceae bacterium]|jgi:hypothetical protein|nr:FixH family protein [Polyangiaceae bacterium]